MLFILVFLSSARNDDRHFETRVRPVLAEQCYLLNTIKPRESTHVFAQAPNVESVDPRRARRFAGLGVVS